LKSKRCEGGVKSPTRAPSLRQKKGWVKRTGRGISRAVGGPGRPDARFFRHLPAGVYGFLRHKGEPALGLKPRARSAMTVIRNRHCFFVFFTGLVAAGRPAGLHQDNSGGPIRLRTVVSLARPGGAFASAPWAGPHPQAPRPRGGGGGGTRRGFWEGGAFANRLADIRGPAGGGISRKKQGCFSLAVTANRGFGGT